MLERRGRRTSRIILLAFIVVIIAVTSVYAYLQLRVDQITDALKKRLPLNSLFIFSDGEKALFFEAFLYNPDTRKGSLFYIPANVGAVIPAPVDKYAGIDALYRRSNPAALQQKIEGLLGVSFQSVIDISRDDVTRLVDLMGGVDVFIPNPVDLSADGRRILLPSGSVSLDGDKARDFISYQDPLEKDADAIGRRQKFLQALLKGMGENSGFLLQRGPLRALHSFLRTNLPQRALGSFIAEMGRFDSERMILKGVLGTTRSVDDRSLLFPYQDGEQLKQLVKQVIAVDASNEAVPPDSLSITIEVLNGTKTTGLAAQARELFQSYDLEVLAPNNADNDQYVNTVVLDRKGNLDNARKVADIIRCTRIFSQPNPLLDQAVDVTVILGKDFDGRYVK